MLFAREQVLRRADRLRRASTVRLRRKRHAIQLRYVCFLPAVTADAIINFACRPSPRPQIFLRRMRCCDALRSRRSSPLITFAPDIFFQPDSVQADDSTLIRYALY